MGVIDRVVTQPVLWVVYIFLPLFSGPLSSYSSFPAIGSLDWHSILLAIGYVGFSLLMGWEYYEVTKEVFNNIHVNNLGYTLVVLFLVLVLLLVASVLMGILGSSSANFFQAIPVVVGFILAIPDFDLEPGWKFKLRFTRFVRRYMDENSKEKLLDSKHCKMLCCNEMMPSLADLQSPLFSCFVKRENRQYCDSTVNPRYEIGLGSVITSSNEHQIDVVVSTPRCGIKRMTMRNTALSRYNLDKSAGFWRDNPRLGILNHGEVKTHCISTEEWIKCCGLEEYIFFTSDNHD